MKTRGRKLSGRLQAVAAMVTKGNVVCDVGCDHGFVPVYLVESGVSPKVIAMDINEGPLEAAREHIRESGLADYIEARLSNGLEALRPAEAETVICAGMGGRLVIKILEEGRGKLADVKELILQPQSELQNVRAYLRENGYRIVEENMILEDGKYYPMMRVCRTGSEQMAGTVWEDKYGPILLKMGHPVLEEYLHREIAIYEQILAKLRENGNGQQTRIEEMMEKRKTAQTALSYFPSYQPYARGCAFLS